MPLRDFPNPVAHINEFFIFTTLSPKQVEAHQRVAYQHPHSGLSCTLFSLDDEMRYTPFAKDYGPLNLAYTFDACIAIYGKLHEKPGSPICLYTSPDPKSKSNMALMVCLYCIIVGHCSAAEAFGPIAEMEMRLFRDAGNSPMEFGISIQDCLYGIEKAIDAELLDMTNFDPDVYRFFETVENGDLNVLGPFVPFASPIDDLWVKQEVAKADPSKANLAALAAARTIAKSKAKSRYPNRSFRCVMQVFKDELVGLVVRLNNDLYDRQFFLQAGISHIDMYFDDGSNPTDEIVRHFIRLSEDVIERQGKRVAVHCKAGLGRTGVLIGAYFIYKYAFSAQEVIAFMRIVRPGMVVGPQQQYMVANQMKWIGWAAQDAVLRELKISASHASLFALHTPPLEADVPLASSNTAVSSRLRPTTSVEELKASARSSPPNPSSTGAAPKCGDAVGQPRKGTGPVRPDSIIEMNEEPAEQQDVQYISSRIAYREHPTSSSQPSRGTKRGAGRSPVDRSSSGASRSQLEVPTPSLARSTSTTSMQSTATDIDDRAHKRRPVKAVPSPTQIRAEPRAYHREIHAPEPEPLTPSRNGLNVRKVEQTVLIETMTKTTIRPAQSPSRNGSEMIRPPTSAPATPLSKLMFIARKSPPTEEVTLVPAAPELARTKASSKEGTLARAGIADPRDKKEEKKEEKKVSSPRFGSRFLSRLGATGKLPTPEGPVS